MFAKIVLATDVSPAWNGIVACDGEFKAHKACNGNPLKASSINDKPTKDLCMTLHQAYGDEIIPKDPALAVRRLPQGMTDVDPFIVKDRNAIIGGFQRYALNRSTT